MFTPESGHFFWNLSNTQQDLVNRLVTHDGTLLVYKERACGFTSLMSHYVSSLKAAGYNAAICTRSNAESTRLNCQFEGKIATSLKFGCQKFHTLVIDEALAYNACYIAAPIAKNLIISCDSRPYLEGRSLSADEEIFHSMWTKAAKHEKFVFTVSRH